MKKLICIIAATVVACVAASAQPRALGVRLSYGAELSYQHTLGSNFLEANLGWVGSNALDVHASYNLIFAHPNWSAGEWNAYVGPAAGAYFYNGGFLVSVGAQLGLEYTFTFPLQLSLDIRPDIISFGSQLLWMYNWYPRLGIRYRF